MPHTRTDMLPRLMRRQRCRCERCGHFVVMVRSVQRRRKIVAKVSDYVRWKTPWGAVAKCRVATVDHFIRRSDGGNNHRNNLKLLCWQCNAAVNDIDQGRHNPHRGRKCRKCGAPKRGRKFRYCVSCRLGFYLMPALLGIMPDGYLQERRNRHPSGRTHLEPRGRVK